MISPGIEGHRKSPEKGRRKTGKNGESAVVKNRKRGTSVKPYLSQ
jgi:hypothetical protein